MNCRSLSVAVGILVVVSSALSEAEEKPGGDAQKDAVLKVADVRAILEAGQTANSLPAGVFLRVDAHLIRYGSETKRHGAGSEKRFRETWEFASDRVHRVVVEPSGKNGDDPVYRRVETIPFDSSGICKELLDAKIFTLGDEEEGERQHFAGTDYDVGHRSIELFVHGKSELHVAEACTVAGFAESDARVFATLYEKLATKARGAFEAQGAGSGQAK